MQLPRPILLHILLEDMIVDMSQPSPNIRTTNGERLEIYMNQRVVCLPSSTTENILLLEEAFFSAGELFYSDNLDIEQFNTFILGLQLKFGISKRNLLEQPIHLKEGNILFLFCSLSIRTFAFKYEFR